MSTITMHGVDKILDRRIRELARREKTSINRTAQALLRRAVGLDAQGMDHREDFLDLAGQWTASDLAEFGVATAGCSEVDAEDWR